MHHFDLYRLRGPSDLGRLSLEEAFASGICLIEWAERLVQQTPAAYLGIHLTQLTEVSMIALLISTAVCLQQLPMLDTDWLQVWAGTCRRSKKS